VSADDDFVELYRSTYPRLVAALRAAGVPGGEADDVAQEAFARTWARWSRVRMGSNPAGYAYRIAFRLLGRRLRRPVTLGRPAQEEDWESAAAADLAVRAAVAAMPIRRRSCVALCLLLGFSDREAARMLRIRPGTVRSHLHAGRRALEQALAELLPS
jgi:RNA polymerase sigma factor (sigma-70 family)